MCYQEIMVEITNLIILIYLVIGSYHDIKKLAVPRIPFLGIMMFAFLWNRFVTKCDLFMLAYAMAPGIFFLFISLVLRNSIGIGDGVVLLTLGLILGGNDCFKITILSLIVLSFYGIVLAIAKRISLYKKIPYIPFLLFAWGVYLFGI